MTITRSTRPTIGDGVVVDYKSTDPRWHVSASRNAVVVHEAEFRTRYGQSEGDSTFAGALARCFVEREALSRGREVQAAPSGHPVDPDSLVDS